MSLAQSVYNTRAKYINTDFRKTNFSKRYISQYYVAFQLLG